MPKTTAARWLPHEDTIIREEWKVGRTGAKDRAAARLTHRTPAAVQIRASYIFRKDEDAGLVVRAPRPGRSITPRAVRKAPVEVKPPIMYAKAGACDPGDLDYIRKRLSHVAVTLANELCRTQASIYAGIAKVAAAGFQPERGSRIATTEEVLNNLSIASDGILRL